MLHLGTVDTTTLGLVEKIQQIPDFKNLRLVGGTSLALQIGHRKSIDIDLFGVIDIDKNKIIEHLKNIGSLQISTSSKTINIFYLDDIKVDIVNYYYKWISEPIIDNNLKLGHLKDIAAMKFSAITNRGTKKDFIDIYFLLQNYSLEQIMQFYIQKYPEGNEFIVLKSLGYFADAEDEPMPYMFKKAEWEEVKNKIKTEVKKIS